MSGFSHTNQISTTNTMEVLEEGKRRQRWEGKVSTVLRNASPDQIFPLFRDFFGLHKWFPNLHTCHGISGLNGEVGCVRYCSGGSLTSQDGNKLTPTWSKERLIAIDGDQKSLSYEMLDSNVGFNAYVSTIKIVEGENGKGCVIQWEFCVDPVQGLKLEDLVNKYQLGLKSMANKMMFSLD